MVEQLTQMAEAEGEKREVTNKRRLLYRELFAAITTERDPRQARLKAMRILEQGERDGVLVPGRAEAEAQAYTNPWFLAFLKLEPGPTLAAVHQPVLVLNGELDRQVPARLDLDAIRASLANNPHLMVKEIPKLNHLFQTAATGGGDEYAQIEETLAPSALSLISNWIREQVQ